MGNTRITCAVSLNFPQPYSTQDYLECVGRLQDHADFLDDVKNDLLSQCSFSGNMEELQDQLQDVQVRDPLQKHYFYC